ncbi:uncharacterized protein LOC132754544 [Ruditapes philippinarum]|uniref:uncharacterized protein LOC132754544 n=1 Tax=Ruditapes philippinarum TaxID=129788 RepID=UPI00295A9DA3|nr:uncharacterized protein LOC132754544 [Ruditapes philippinarum]
MLGVWKYCRTCAFKTGEIEQKNYTHPSARFYYRNLLVCSVYLNINIIELKAYVYLKLNEKKIHASVTYFSQSYDIPRQSAHPWPLCFQKGGGVIQPAVYLISTPFRYERQILNILDEVADENQDIYSQMSITTERDGEKTPPMILSSVSGHPDTPDYKTCTP